MEFGPSVTAAFDLQLQGLVAEALLDLAQGQVGWSLARLPVDLQYPTEWFDVVGDGRYAVVADEHPRRRGHRIIEEMSRCFGVQWAFAQDPQTRLTGDAQLSRLTGPSYGSKKTPRKSGKRSACQEFPPAERCRPPHCANRAKTSLARWCCARTNPPRRP